MGLGGDAVEPVEQVTRIVARTGQRQVLAGAPVELRHALAANRIDAVALVLLAIADEQQLRIELVPLGPVQLFEVERSHGRLPNNHWATPSTRRVTSPSGRLASPCTLAASAASSSSRSIVSVGARPASAITAEPSRSDSGRAGATG